MPIIDKMVGAKSTKRMTSLRRALPANARARNDQRHAHVYVVCVESVRVIGPVLSEALTVVGRDDDEGVLEAALLRESL